jgi:hypothetical protein
LEVGRDVVVAVPDGAELVVREGLDEEMLEILGYEEALEEEEVEDEEDVSYYDDVDDDVDDDDDGA